MRQGQGSSVTSGNDEKIMSSNPRTSPKAQKKSQPHSAEQRGLNSTQTKLSSTAAADLLDIVNLAGIPAYVNNILNSS